MHGAFRRRIEAREGAVRALLAETRARLRATGVSEAACGTVEIALAEALNNIVEHAYAGRTGRIGIAAALVGTDLCCTLTDRGRPLPGLRLPEGPGPEIGRTRATMPEGGFGWFLIRSLTRGLHYERAGDVNRLTLCFDLARESGPPA